MTEHKQAIQLLLEAEMPTQAKTPAETLIQAITHPIILVEMQTRATTRLDQAVMPIQEVDVRIHQEMMLPEM
jgi:hypothetical protein